MIMSFIKNYFQKATNSMIVHQDYELAEQFMKMDVSFFQNEDGSLKDGFIIGKDLFNLEGIFILTSRSPKSVNNGVFEFSPYFTPIDRPLKQIL